MDAASILSTFGQTYGVEMNLSESNVCSVSFDNDDIDFELAGDTLYIIAEVARQVDNKTALMELLSANLTPSKTAGAHFAFDKSYNAVLLIRSLQMPMEYNDFENIVVHFLKALRQWKVDILEFKDEDEVEFQPSDMNMIAI